jgi:pyochelin biosynthetic protein PchC
MPATDADHALWFRRFNQAPGGRVRLVCFPHAGGAASHYYPIAQALAPDTAVLAVQYPGRQDRRRERCFDQIAPLADAVTAAFRGLAQEGPYAFFGHSMGAIVAFEVAQRLRRLDLPGPVRLIASGRRAPSTLRHETVHLRDDAGLVDELVRLGGSDRRSLQDKDILAMALPPTRADYKAIETYVQDPAPPLDCPITVLSGVTDTHTTPAELDAWTAHTAARTDFQSFEGGHFFIDACRPQVVAAIKDALARDEAALSAV